MEKTKKKRIVRAAEKKKKEKSNKKQRINGIDLKCQGRKDGENQEEGENPRDAAEKEKEKKKTFKTGKMGHGHRCNL